MSHPEERQQYMKVIMIYGPPAAGKLTVARKVAEMSDYKVFHNHLVNDYISELLTFGTEEYARMAEDMKFLTLKYAVQSDVSLIMTACYAPPLDDQFIRDLTDFFEEHNVAFYTVHLFCSRDSLKERVLSESRKKYHKIQDVDFLEEFMTQYEFFQLIPGRESLVIDNTDLSPEQAARKIMDYTDD